MMEWRSAPALISFHLQAIFSQLLFSFWQRAAWFCSDRRPDNFMPATPARWNSLPYVICQCNWIVRIHALQYLSFCAIYGLSKHPWIVCASMVPYFEQCNPWIVHIHGLHITYSVCVYIYMCVCVCIYIYIPMPGGSFDVGSALSKPYAREQIYARGQKLVLSSSFSSDEESRRFSFSAVLETWHTDINPL